MSDLEFIQSLAREAGRIQLSRLNSALTIERKVQETNLVTEVDRAIDNLLVSALRRNFPGHAIVSEEGDLERVADARLPGCAPGRGRMRFFVERSERRAEHPYGRVE